MHRTSLLLCSLCLAGCGDKKDGQPADGPVASDTVRKPAGYGAACAQDADCESSLCVEGVCSKLCRQFVDCPTVSGKPFECGEVPTHNKVACYPRRYAAAKHGIGYDCTLDNLCGVGFKCMGLEGTTDRYCSGKCKADWDCPPRYRCAAVRVGKDAPETEKWCRRREFCHPCAVDDQCGPDNLCVADINGGRYCGKSCTKGGGGSCPAFAKCEEAGNGKLQCKHKKGYCWKGLAFEGDLCEPCISHGWFPTAEADFTIAEEGPCKKEGFCYIFSSYVMEAGCIMPCGANDSCPSGGAIEYACAKLTSLGSGKICTSDAQCTEPNEACTGKGTTPGKCGKRLCVPVKLDPDSGQKIFGSCVP
jgi:hypothetical protein